MHCRLPLTKICMILELAGMLFPKEKRSTTIEMAMDKHPCQSSKQRSHTPW